MPDIFISHVAKDGDDAIALAERLKHVGYSTWYYEHNASAGVPFESQVMGAIEDMDAELLHAFECEKAILPLVKNMTFEDFQRQKPVWKFRLRGRVAKPLRISNRTETNADLISDLKTMGVHPTQPAPIEVHPSQGVQRSKDQILVRLRLLAPEEDLGEFVTLARSGKLDCSYRILDCNSSTFSAPNAAQIAMLPGGLFVIIREISRDALIELSLNSDDRSWKSHPLTVDAVPAQLFRGS